MFSYVDYLTMSNTDTPKNSQILSTNSERKYIPYAIFYSIKNDKFITYCPKFATLSKLMWSKNIMVYNFLQFLNYRESFAKDLQKQKS
jgi:hypothetical protein